MSLKRGFKPPNRQHFIFQDCKIWPKRSVVYAEINHKRYSLSGGRNSGMNNGFCIRVSTCISTNSSHIQCARHYGKC